MTLILVILLVLILLGSVGGGYYGRDYGPWVFPAGGVVGLLVLILLIWLIVGMVR